MTSHMALTYATGLFSRGEKGGVFKTRYRKLQTPNISVKLKEGSICPQLPQLRGVLVGLVGGWQHVV